MAGLDLNLLLQQAQALQERMKESQERLAEKKFQGSAGGGMVLCTVNGKGEVLEVKIDKQAVDPRDVPMLEDLVVAALNSALRAAREAAAAESPLSGMGMPDLSSLAGLFPGGFPK